MAKPEAVWQTALGELQLQMTRAAFDTWLKQSQVVAYEDGTFIIGVQNGYAKDWLDNRLSGTVKRTLTGILNRSVEIRFIVQAPTDPAPEVEILHIEESIADDSHHPARPHSVSGNGGQTNGNGNSSNNPDYTFDQFVVASSNRLAHAAALAVTENPAQRYNPLFVYGGVGLGKTHLLKAIGYQASARGYQVLYVSSETFVNELINAIRTQSQEDFRNRYRTADFLLIDDIQFIAGKESTQEEFFHTFNTLYTAGKQIVLSSDRPPQSITTLEERLSSRFQWGLIADIQPPDLETRIAILRSKAVHRHAHVPDDVTYFIAHQMQSSIRELEGGLNRVLASASLLNEPVTLQLAQQTLSPLVGKKARVSLEDIVDTVSTHYGISRQDLVGACRKREYVLPRQIAMYLARQETSASLPQIGQCLGGRDHTTVLHGSQKMEGEIERKTSLRRDLVTIREKLYLEAA